MSTHLRIVASREVAAATPPKLSDWAEERLEDTVEIPAYWNLYRTTFAEDADDARPAPAEKRCAR